MIDSAPIKPEASTCRWVGSMDKTPTAGSTDGSWGPSIDKSQHHLSGSSGCLLDRIWYIPCVSVEGEYFLMWCINGSKKTKQRLPSTLGITWLLLFIIYMNDDQRLALTCGGSLCEGTGEVPVMLKLYDTDTYNIASHLPAVCVVCGYCR